MEREFNVGVVIGRFQPLMRAQFEQLIQPAFEENDLLIVLLGSSDRARTARDPLTAKQREDIFMAAFAETYGKKPAGKPYPEFVPIRDFLYSDTRWIMQVQSAVGSVVSEHADPAKAKITLYGVGDKKYLGYFPQWEANIAKKPEDWKILVSEIVNHPGRFISGDQTLAALYDADRDEIPKLPAVMDSTWKYLLNWAESKEFERIQEEYQYIEEYKARTQVGKYPIIFHTVDNVAIYKGNILLVKRRSKPGKGLWALPGGFLNADESLQDGAMRELREETKLRVKKEWLKAQRTFDAPERSLRGRTITQAFLWQIPDWRDVPQVKASSDAEKARWFTLAEVTEDMSDQLFEDHYDIIEALVKQL